MREVASVGVGPDDDRVDQDETVTEDVGLPEHERDETRRRTGATGEDDAPGLAVGTDTGGDDATGLPEFEDDTARGGDTAPGEQNP
jgi:hypothetical protein